MGRTTYSITLAALILTGCAREKVMPVPEPIIIDRTPQNIQRPETYLSQPVEAPTLADVKAWGGRNIDLYFAMRRSEAAIAAANGRIDYLTTYIFKLLDALENDAGSSDIE